jgi:hypothetical protein
VAEYRLLLLPVPRSSFLAVVDGTLKPQFLVLFIGIRLHYRVDLTPRRLYLTHQFIIHETTIMSCSIEAIIDLFPLIDREEMTWV